MPEMCNGGEVKGLSADTTARPRIQSIHVEVSAVFVLVLIIHCQLASSRKVTHNNYNHRMKLIKY
jgi:hypothetical protein